jgi:DNA-binding transcriptional ArsR family regulator
MARSREFRITRSDQIHALATPARQEILDALLSSGPSTVAEIAGALGRPADSLYFHTRILKQMGLVVEVGTRRRGRREEVVYDVPGRPMRIYYDLGDKKASAGIVAAIGAMIRITQRDFNEAVAAGTAATDGPYRALWGARVKGWITKAQLKRVNRHLQGICELMLSPGRRHGSRLHSVTFVITPIEPNTRGKARKP